MAQPRFAVFVKPWKTLSIVEIGEKVKSLGFDFIELPVREGFACEPETVTRTLPKAVKELSEIGIKVLAVTAESALDDERLYAACAEAGIRQNRIMLRTRDMSYFEAESQARKELDAALPWCERYGLRIGIQNHKGRFIASSAIGMYHLLKDYDPDYIGVVWDPAHNALEGEEPDFAIDILQNYLYYINLKNGYWQRINSFQEEAQWKVHWTPGSQGRASWTRVSEKLKSIGYKEPFCFSAEYSDESQLDDFIKQDLAYAKKVFA